MTSLKRRCKYIYLFRQRWGADRDFKISIQMARVAFISFGNSYKVKEIKVNFKVRDFRNLYS